jgi:hypothetical protein
MNFLFRYNNKNKGQESNLIVKRIFNLREKKPYSNCDLKEIKIDSNDSEFFTMMLKKSGNYNYKGSIVF